MYARLTLSAACTLQQVRDDIVAALTGTASNVADLVSVIPANSEFVKNLNPEWTLVQHLSESDTRCHFVLSGVDDGGAVKTMGVILTDTSGVLGLETWYCGAWDAAAKRPAAIDVTGWSMASNFTPADFLAGSVKNSIWVPGVSSGPFNGQVPISGANYKSGSLQITLWSRKGATAIGVHFGVTSRTAALVVDVPRSIGLPLTSSELFPWALISAADFRRTLGPTVGIGAYLGGTSTSEESRGLCVGTLSGTTFLNSAPLTSEISSPRFTPGAASAGSLFLSAGFSAIASATNANWLRGANGQSLIMPKAMHFSPTSSTPFDAFVVPGMIRSSVIPVGSGSALAAPFLTELVLGPDTYVCLDNSFNLAFHKA